MAFWGENLLVKGLKGHSQLWDRADHQFSHFEKSSLQPEIKETRRVHLEIRFNLCSVSLDFQSFSKKLVFECAFAHPMILFYHI